jgi:hypothetical protein
VLDRLLVLLRPMGDGDFARRKGCCRKTALSAWPRFIFAKETVMKCDICSLEMENSEELRKHKERVHPQGRGDRPMDELETPDLLGDTPEESATSDAPKATH